jgi:hypothetical protein
MNNPAMTVDGVPLYSMQGTMDSTLPIYRPEYGGGGLLNDGKDFSNLRSNFAGGLLNGFQYDPNSNRFNAIAPSGVYTADPNQASNVTTSGDQPRALSFRDAFDLMYNKQGQNGVGMPPALFEALGSDNASGRFKDLFGMEFDPDSEYDPSSDDYKKLKGMLDDPYYWDQSR